MSTGGTATVDLANRKVALNAAGLAPDTNIACTFTNDKLPTVTVTKVSNGGTGLFTFTGTNGWASQNITTATSGVGVAGATQILAAAGAATEIVESAPPAGFALTGISCSGLGSGGTATNDLAARKVTLNAAATAAGSDIACTFTNTKLPTVTVTKVSNGGTGLFTFTGTNGWASQNITTAASGVGVAGATQILAAAGATTEIVESAPPAGFALTGISCSGLGAGGTATNDLAARKVTLNAAATAAGSDIACTFTNTKLPTVTVTKVSNGGTGLFTFTGTNGWASQDITTVTSGVGVAGATQILAAAGATTEIVESAPPAGFALTGISCSGLGAGGTATNDLAACKVTLNAAATAAGSDIACTFTNTKLPTVTVTKVSNGGTGLFTFTGSNGWSSQDITTVTSGVGVAGATQTLTAAGAATEIVESAPPAGFVLTGISCSGLGSGGTATNDLAARKVTLNAAATAAGSDIACTFTNTILPTVTVTKISNGSTGLFAFTGSNGWANQNITTVTPGVGVAGATQTLAVAGSATEIVEGAPPSGFGLVGISCSGMGAGGTATNDLPNRKVTLNAAATAAGSNIVCTFTNDIVRTLTVTKSLSPVSDAGQFVMTANGTAGAAAGNGATASATVAVGGTASFSEAGSGGTNLANYTIGYSCDTTPATTGSASSGSFTMPDADVICTLTNTRKSATLTLRKSWVDAISGDTATVASSGFTNNASSGASVSSGGNTTTGVSATVYAGESGTIGESFSVGSAANYTATLACTGNATALSGSTLTVDPADTAIVCTETNTSSLSISGYVYDDANHTSSRDGFEAGTGQTLWVKLTTRAGLSCATPALAAALVDPGSGAYSIVSVGGGNYCLILDTNGLFADVTPNDPAGWVGTETPAGIRAVALVSPGSAQQNFGLFSGSVLTGKIFSDTGTGGGTANNGVVDGAESGIAGVDVRITDELGSTVYTTATTDGGGSYTLYIPGTLAAGTALNVVEFNPATHISTGASLGNTTGLYDRAADATAFTLAAGTAYAGVDFGDVPTNKFLTDGSQTALPGAALFYPHSFTAGSAGTVAFSTAAFASPALSGWVEVLYRDSNCNALPDAGEPQITAALPLAAGELVCILVKEFVPASAPFNAQNTLVVTSVFTYTGASPGLSSSAARVDVTTVGLAAGAGLGLNKSVDKAAALPGAVLVYTITYTNLSSEPLGSIVIDDATPSFTTFVSAGCTGPPPADISACAVTQQPAPGVEGAVRWTLSGTLAPGASGSVTYSVRVAN